MTPRHDVDAIKLGDDPASIRAALVASPHSRLPVYDRDLDEMVGVVQAKELLNAYLQGRTPEIRDFIRQAPVIPDSADARDVIIALRDSPIHVGLVHDEKGHFRGLVTTADILGSIVRRILRRGCLRPSRPMSAARTARCWWPAGCRWTNCATCTGIDIGDDNQSHTAAGFVVQGFGHLPQVGDRFEAQGWRFEVLDLDGRRVDKILVEKLSKRRAR